MKKIPTIFIRDYDTHKLTDQPNPECSWVFEGIGRATRKFNGTAVMIRNGDIFKRFDCKEGRTPPAGFESADEPDPITKHWPGWVPFSDGPEDKWLRLALDNSIIALAEGKDDLVPIIMDGTFEAVGPHFQGNPEFLAADILVRHGAELVSDVPRTFNSLSYFLGPGDIEGIVYHHPDGRMAKIKAKDFGFKRAK